MSYRTQYQDRVRQALATDARAAGTTIDELPLMECYGVAWEIAQLYPQLDMADLTESVYAARSEPKEERDAQ